MLRRADAGDHVLALGVDQVFAVELVGAGRGVAGEGDAGGAILAHVAEHHRLDVDRGAPFRRNIVQPPIGLGALILPRAEHRADRAPKLGLGVLREGLLQFALDQLLIDRDHLAPILGGEVGVERLALVELVVLERVLEQLVIGA